MQLPRTPLAALSLALLTACAARENPNSAIVAELEARHRIEMERFEAQKQRLAAGLDVSVPRDFGADGRLYLGDVELLGRPWDAYLRVEFYYVSADRPTRGTPEVTLAVADPVTGEAIHVTQELTLPFGITLGRGSTYRSWIEVPTDGLHEREGWVWDIVVEPRAR